MKPLLEYGEILTELFCRLGYLWASVWFCKKYVGALKGSGGLLAALASGGWLLFHIMVRPYGISHIFLMTADHMIFAGLIILLFRGGWEKKLLAASVLMAVMTLTGNFWDSFLSCLVLMFRHGVQKIQEPFLNDREGGVIVCVSFCIVILAVVWLSKSLDSVFCPRPGRWYGALAIPLLGITGVTDVVNWGSANGVMVRSGGTMGLYYDQIFSHMEICVVTGLSMAAAGSYVSGMGRICLEQEKNSRYYAQIAVYKELERQHRQSERLRHDMKNHIIALSGLYGSREWEKMGEYLKTMEAQGLEGGKDVTGNRAVDALLYQKRQWAKREKVQWECDVRIPKEWGIQEFDLCVLLGNLLDNALEECGRLGHREEKGKGEECFVSVKAGVVKRCFLIEVKNSMDMWKAEERKGGSYWKQKMKVHMGEMGDDEGNGPGERVIGFSHKENPWEHGIGLLNVRDVVEKYNGVMNIETKDGSFVVSVLMPFSDDET